MKRTLSTLLLALACVALMVACGDTGYTQPPVISLQYETTATTVTIAPLDGYEYRIDNGEWQDGNVFTNLTPNSMHALYMRKKAVLDKEPGATYYATVTLPKADQNAPTLELIQNATQIKITPVDGAEYKLGDGAWGEISTFTGLTPNTDYVVSIRYAETKTHNASAAESKTVTTLDKEEIDVFIISGQSNALGISHIAELGLTETYPEVMIYYDGENGQANGQSAARWNIVKPGLGLDSRYFGPEIGMSQVLRSFYDGDEGKRVAIIKYTWGGTSMWDWWLSPTSVAAGLGNKANVNFYKNITGDENCARLYFDLVNTVKNGIAALGSGYNVTFRGMAWMQGEGDAGHGTVANHYETILTNFINDFRAEINEPDLPVAIGRINSKIAGYEDIVIEAERAVAENVANCTFVDTSDLEQGYTDWWHFRARDMVKLGNRFASALMEFHDYGAIGTLDPITLETGLGAQPRLPQYGWATAQNGARRLVSLTWDAIDASVLGSVGTKSITAKAKDASSTVDVTATLNVHGGATVDGVLDDAVWQTATAHTIQMSAQFPVTAVFRTAAGANGLYFAVEVTDARINNNFTNTQSFDWDICLNDGIELYVDASGSSVTTLTAKSAAIWISASDILRIYDGHATGHYGDENGVNDNRYQQQDARFADIVREVRILGTPNQDADTDTGVIYEVYVPFSCFDETDLSKYRVTLGIRSLAWLPNQNPNFEAPYAALNVGSPTGGTLNNGNIQTWYPYSQLV